MEQEGIALNDREAVARWCRWLGCSEADLIRAVWKVGPRPVDVDRFFWTIPLSDPSHATL